MLIVAIGLTELLAHLVYRGWRGEFIWEGEASGYAKAQDVFSVRDFIYEVDDERYFTHKKNYAYSKSKSDADGVWSLTTDEHGFRAGTHKYGSQQQNIVFLGDSVPFGWGVGDDETVPSKFYRFLEQVEDEPSYGVVNGAIPSYSLYQAIKRYDYEIRHTLPVKYIVLQTYDPVNQFEKFGRQWHKNLNWYTQRWAAVSTPPLLKYSALYWLLTESRRFVSNPELDPNDRIAFDNFQAENIASLDELHALLRADEVGLILLPVTVPEAAKQKKSAARQAAIAAHNETLKDYAAAHPDVYFFDVEAYLYQYGADDVFIDSCCHLSEVGATLQAEFILTELAAIDDTLRPPNLPNPSHQALNYIAAAANPGDAIISATSIGSIENYIKPQRDDLIYFDKSPGMLPAQLQGRWYIFYGAKHIPEHWSPMFEVKEFDYVLLVHQTEGCQIRACVEETTRLFTELTLANPGSYLAQKLNHRLAGLAELTTR